MYRGRKYEMLFWDNRASLVIKDSEPSDSAKYRCELSTPLGRVQSLGSLIVYSEFQLVLYFSPITCDSISVCTVLSTLSLNEARQSNKIQSSHHKFASFERQAHSGVLWSF